MEKFCTKCGKELVDGKCPNCRNEKQGIESSIDIKESFMDCISVFKNIFVKPIETMKEFVCENKWVAGIIMTIMAAISAGLYKVAVLKNMWSSGKSMDSFIASDFSDLLSSALSGNLGLSSPDYLKEFMISFFMNFAGYALIIGIGYLIISKLFNGKASMKEMMNAVAIGLSFILFANVLNSILVFIDGQLMANIREYIGSFASIMNILILYGAVKQIAKIDNNKLFVSVASMLVLANAAMDVLQKLFQ